MEPRDPNYQTRVRESFKRQRAMATLGIEVAELAPGRAVFTMPFNPAMTQQLGYLHAGTVTTALDSACGYAAYTLMEADADVLSVEFKANFLAPAKGERFVIRAEVVKSGRTITVSEGKAYAIEDGAEKLIASMTCTLMAVRSGV